ncbi:MAG: hypothetical protein ACLT1T_06130 [Oscillospiraceae bacterium]
MKRRLFALALALLLAVSLPVSALARDWYIDDGDITISATESGQTVSQGNTSEADDAPVIKQRDSETATGSTITIKSTGDATANVTIKDVNISSKGDAIDVDGKSSAKITLEGKNKIFSETGSALHVSSGDVTIDGDGSLEAGNGDETAYSQGAKIGSHENEDMSGSIHITGGATVTAKRDSGYGDGAGIGSGNNGDMSGSITIDGNANVDAIGSYDGAGIGAGNGGKMSGDITIGGNAQVTAASESDGAGIGSGWTGDMSGNITIGDSAQVTAWGDDEGAGIGSGGEGAVSGTITIGGSAQVTAGSGEDGAGIGAGEDGSIAGSGKIIIRDNAKVTAIGEDGGAGIGAGEDELMAGMIIIQDNAQVTAIAGDSAAAIGSDDRNEMTGTIFIIGNARVTTGILDDDAVHFDYDTKEIIYTLDPDEDAIGYIGDSSNSHHDSANGHYVIGPDVTINGISGSDIEALKQYVNMRLNSNGEPENLTKLEIRSENGEFTVDASGEGTVEKILYGGSETVPTAPGTYPVTCVVRLGNGTTLEFQIGTFIVPEPPAEAAQPAPVYHVTDADGHQIPYTAAREGGVLTIRVDAAYARLTLTADEAQALTAQGVEKVVFITTGATSAFRPADLTAYKDEAPFVLTHDGETVTFTAGETDLASLLLQA